MEDPAQDVAAEGVGAQPVERARRGEASGHVLAERLVRREERRRRRQREPERHHDEGRRRSADVFTAHLDPRVDQRVGEVDQEVRQDVDRRHDDPHAMIAGKSSEVAVRKA